MSINNAIAANAKRVWSLLYFYVWRKFKCKEFSKVKVTSQHSDIYVEKYGLGPPLFLLHGGYLQLESFAAQIPVLAKNFTIYAVDSRGHGRSSHGGHPLSYNLLAQDVANITDVLGCQSAHFIGWSDGANTCLNLAQSEPNRIDKMVLISANFHPSGLKVAASKPLRKRLFKLVLRGLYRRFSPHPEHWDTLDEQLQYLWRTEPDFSLAELAQIDNRTLILGGEFDLILREHFEELANNMPNAQLNIIKNAGHDLHISHYQEVNQLIKSFFL